MESKAGHIVILSNPSLKGLLKIVDTRSPVADMLREMNSSTELPTPFHIEKSYLIQDPETAIRAVYDALGDFRVSGQKNYFNLDIEQAVNSIDQHCVKIGFIYILSNPTFKGDLLKIGSTKKTMEERVSELNASESLPAPFEIEAYFETTDPEEVEKTVRRALAPYRVSEKKYYDLDLDLAVATVSEVCRSEPMGLGIHEIVEDEDILKIDRIIRDCDRAIAKNRGDRNALLERARAHFKLGSHQKAATDFGAAIALKPDDEIACVALIERGQLFYSNREYGKAIADFDRAIQLGPDDEWTCIALFTRGRSHQALGNHEKAILDYDRTIALKPDDEWICVAYIERGKAYYNLKEYQKALDDYNKALALNPDDEWASVAYVERGQVYYCLGDYERAISDHDKTLELKPEGK